MVTFGKIIKKILTTSAGHPLDADPPEREHGTVVVHVQERELVFFFAQDEEERVHEFQYLGEVVPPDSSNDLANKKKCSDESRKRNGKSC